MLDKQYEGPFFLLVARTKISDLVFANTQRGELLYAAMPMVAGLFFRRW